jgi:hypothetical protein
MPDWQTHLLSPLAMKVSNTGCAVSAKSPYWASHIDSKCGLEYEYPTSKPSTPGHHYKYSMVNSVTEFNSIGGVSLVAVSQRDYIPLLERLMPIPVSPIYFIDV